ncbi:MAG TPA: CYTH domain-containing protein [Methylotenera sp.]|nr:CYTH domain-containing protein [Methylotenera sp.]
MAIEIERKYLVIGEGWKNAPSIQMIQAYLSRDKSRTVRVRVAGDKAFLTIKGENHGATRAEFEYEVPLLDARSMITMCEGPVINKTRYKVNYEGFTWEVDVFADDNEGLVIAEIELRSEDEVFPVPDWIGAEVTGDPKYYNSSLISFPFQEWQK